MISYLMSRFPKVSETFILYELLELERQGVRVEVFPLLRQHDEVVHAEAEPVVQRTHYAQLLSRRVLAAQYYWLRRRPRAYAGAWWSVLRGSVGSPKFLARTLVVVPLAAHFAREMQSLGIGHLHAHYATHPALAAYVVHRLTRLPYSFTAHAHDIYVDQTMLIPKVADASFVVAISEFNRRLLLELCPEAESKISVIHCGVDAEFFQPLARQPGTDTFTVLCVASLEEYKGQRYLLEACSRLRAQGVGFRCLLVGAGEDRAGLERTIAARGLEDCVVLLGAQPRDQVSSLMAQADVVVLPSITTRTGKMEGIPVALMEALATGRPVVATNISGIPELIEHGRTGLLVPERDADALADALVLLYHDRALGERLASAGREKVLAEFNLRKSAAALHALLERSWGTSSGAAVEQVGGGENADVAPEPTFG
ncbi:MAG TPA: glycosyltransferase [Gemmatimonadaceae bacterium]|nr:glycosyltransferase [Gemmatimonadaceae bacterium]